MPTVRVNVSLKPSLLDSAGRAVTNSLRDLGFNEVTNARIGKTITLEMEKVDEDRIKSMCTKLLANSVIEDFSYEVEN
ncbi:phosphoribosylformylglycinamidine synthase subunit PurS [Kamptonema cortianum]|nr:phosphoribosylformylglycinamidine synthase subunit PurS [Geitlerinema splendidum]MDK3161054.1 phosphoribosylformylglycinamidine synthase subunit PurS [Kamptonema cortianum]